MKNFLRGALRVEFALGLALLIGGALFAAADVLVSWAGPWLWSMDAGAVRWMASLSVLLSLALLSGSAVWWTQRRGRSHAKE